MMQKKVTGRARRKLRIRKKVHGTTGRPRLAVFRSSKHIYAQVIDDSKGTTIAHASSVTGPGASKVESAKSVGSAVAKACIDKGVEQVVFDRGGYRYHGRVRALAESAREAGLQF